MNRTMNKLLTSCFGLGYLPVAPGTWGSLPPAVVFALMCRFGAPFVLISVVMTVLALIGSVLCVKFAPAVIAAADKTDPPEVVVDEFAGQAVVFIGAYAMGPGTIIAAVAGFLLFRFFDIVKPWPIRKLEKLPKAWGVLADDLMAGVYAAVVLQICIRLWLAGFVD